MTKINKNHVAKNHSTNQSAMNRLIIIYLTLQSILCLFASQAIAEDSKAEIRGFLKNYCINCHGYSEQNADRRFDDLSFDFSNTRNGELLQEILDQLNLGEMPPSDEVQPTSAETKKMVEMLTETLSRARNAARADSTGKVVLRRINRGEYLNTVRDLFSLNMTDFDPTVAFPADDLTEGFDNVGEGLLMSDFLLAQYLEAAEQVVEKAIRPGPQPTIQHIVSEGDLIHGGGHSDQRGFKRALVRDQFTRAYVKRKYAGVPHDGEYVLRIRANTVRWSDHRFDVEQLGYDPTKPPRIRVLVTSRTLGDVSTRIFGEYEIRDGEPVELEVRGFLQRGYEFAVEWANGPRGSQKRIMRKVFPQYLPEETVELARNPVEMYLGAAPELRLHRLEQEGPFYDQWPLPGFARFFGDVPKVPTQNDLQRCLVRFAEVAWRGPADEQSLKRYLDLAMSRYESTGDFWQAAKIAVRALLSSPRFLYLIEPEHANDNRILNDYEIATRLSYFLWSSTPDEELLGLAFKGELAQSRILIQQVDRMLDDPKARSFSENFTGQWLQLRRLGEMPPDPATNQAYYAEDLESAMRQESLLLFNHLLRENASVLDFIKADYTFINGSLARHYGIAGIVGNEFQRVSLNPSHRRGGLLGHGSILTLTSNGVETQPVERGIWVLENLLGTPPSPPPPDVQPIEPDTRGVNTIRELMAKHRTIATCNECHKKIDPIGLAMEKFDHLGRFRQRYTTGSAIDPSGVMPDGSEFDGMEGIREYLLSRPDQFTKCLTEKIMIYALGRRLAFVDRGDIDQIVTDAAKQGYGLRDLLKLIVLSEAFKTK